MTAQRTRTKLYTLSELRKFTKARLIRIILSLQKGRLNKAIKRARKGIKRRTTGRRKKLSPGIHFVKMKGGRTRKVKVLSNGRWRFMKGTKKGGKRRKSAKRRLTKRRRSSKRRKR